MELEILRPAFHHGEYVAQIIHHPNGCCHMYEGLELNIDFRFVENPPFENGEPHIYVGKFMKIGDDCNFYDGRDGRCLLPYEFEWLDY